MHIVLVGLNHRSAPIDLRERLAFHREHLPEALARLQREVGLQEAAILSTCNRVEIYAGVPALDGAIERLQGFLSAHGRVTPPSLAPALYTYTEPHSVRHLFSVASGLDSMVLGEAEILQQVKHAYESARACGATGKVFNVLFQRALNAAKAVRTETPIGRGCTSIGAVAVELAEKIFGNVAQAAVLLVGAGTIGELTLQRLSQRGVRQVRVMNRSLERACHVAAHHCAMAVAWDQLPMQLLEVDILISSTSAPGVLLSRAEVALAMRQRHQRPLYVVDLGVPRNIDPAVSEVDNVYLFNVDDLQHLVARSHDERRQALRQSEAIIERKAEGFLSWWQREVLACGPSSLEVVAAP